MEYEQQVAWDFVRKLQELAAIYSGGFSDDTRRLYDLLILEGKSVCMKIFEAARDIFVQNEENIKGENVAALAESAKLQAPDQKLLNELLGLWQNASRKDKKESFRIVKEMLKDVLEWKSLV